MRLEEIGSKEVLTLAPTDSVKHAFKLMMENDIHHLPVVEGRKVVGIVSDRDLLIVAFWISAWKSLTKEHTTAGKKRVSELMSSPVTVLAPSDSVERAAALMLQGRFSAVPLEFEGKLVGIVTETDILQSHLRDSAKPTHCSWSGMKVADQMSSALVTAKPTDHVMPSFNTMKQKKIRHLPIIDEGKLVGLISDGDLRRSYGREIAVNLAREEPNPDTLYHSTLEDSMSQQLETISPRATLVDAATRMVSGRFGALPVTENDKLLGIITETDLLRALVSHC